MQAASALTEQIDHELQAFDTWSPEQMAQTVLSAQVQSLQAVLATQQQLAQASRLMVERLQHSQGRLIYTGAGSAGLQACIDGVELPATFGWPSERLILLLAGGLECLLNDKGFAEDNVDLARIDTERIQITPDDVVIAVTASGSTPYTLAVCRFAKQQGALVIGITNSAKTLLHTATDLTIGIASGMEIVAGSTRMAAGTSQKIVLNTLSTMVMAQLGYLYDNLMVNMQVHNIKLIQRAFDIVQHITQADKTQIMQALQTANYQIPLAVLLIKGVKKKTAQQLLVKHGNRLRAALAELDCSPF